MTPDEKRHIYLSKHVVGCLPCLLNGWCDQHADYHHVIDGNKRYGHLVGFPQCLWHHRGKVDWAHTLTLEETLERMGPSFELHRKEFLKRYGTEMELVELNKYAIELYKERPWLEHEMPPDISRMIRSRHMQREWVF